MCWQSISKPIRMVAERDIPVQKVLKNCWGKLFSPVYACSEWVIGDVKECEIGKVVYNSENGYYFINEGLHSCERIYSTNFYFFTFYDYRGTTLFFKDDDDIICDAVIPAGSEYYLNKDWEYVSNRLKIVGLHKKVSEK